MTDINTTTSQTPIAETGFDRLGPDVEQARYERGAAMLVVCLQHS